MKTDPFLRGCRQAVAASILLALSGNVFSASERVERFDIYRNGSQVGWHEIRHQWAGDERKVSAVSEIKIGLLGIPLYSFRYEATERWDPSGLVSLQASVNDDGDQSIVRGHRDGDRFVWTVNGERREAAMPVFPTNHWNREVLGQRRVLNTLTGRMNDVAIQPLTGSDRVDDGAALLPRGNRYQYSGELNLVSWYDSAGQWRGMKFEGRDGSTIVYRCVTCDDDRVAVR